MSWGEAGSAGVDQVRLGLGGAAVVHDAVVEQQRLDLLGYEDPTLAVAFADDGDEPPRSGRRA
jgi:hypothetical protein